MNDPRKGPGRFDVIGIGALNLDYIADASALVPRTTGRLATSGTAELSAAVGSPVEWGTEKAVDEEAIYAVLEEMNSASLTASLGGSSFNAVVALAQMRLGLELAFLGVAGRVPVRGLSSVEQLRSLGVDTSRIQVRDDLFCGVCFSLLDSGERTLLTHWGANALMSDFLQQDPQALVEYLALAKVIHVTSFLDPETPAHLLNILRELKRVSPDTLISFDPGHVWTQDPDASVCGLLELSEYLLVNYREFRAIGGARNAEPDDDVAARLLDRFDSATATIVVKRSSGIHSYWRAGGGLQSALHPQQPLRDEEIEDATGAGDVFAAGLLAVTASEDLQNELGVLLGMRLARHKLRYAGSSGHAGLAELTREFLGSTNPSGEAALRSLGVFIAHGGDSHWLAVKSFVEEQFELPVHSFESGVWSSTQIGDVLTDYLGRCSIAICILTVEDLVEGAHGSPRQNVVHEIGLFQGKYGADRVIVMLEEGCRFSPRTATAPIVFPKKSVKSSFWFLREQLAALGAKARSSG